MVQGVYIDDRTLVARRPDDLQDAVEAWEEWTTTVGMTENAGKKQYLAVREADRDRLLARGVQRRCVKEQVQVLGFVWAESKRRKAAAQELERIPEARRRAAKMCVLRLGRRIRGVLLRGTVIPAATFGWMDRPPCGRACQTLTAAVNKAEGGATQCGSRFLRMLRRGHACDARFMGGFVTAMKAFKHCRDEDSTERWNEQLGVTHTTREWMKQLDWLEDDRYRWRHAVRGQRELTCAPREIESENELKHILREGWRRSIFEKFWRSPRRDARELRSQLGEDAPYDEGQMRTLRKWWSRGNFAIDEATTGALTSGAMEEIIRRGRRRCSRRRGGMEDADAEAEDQEEECGGSRDDDGAMALPLCPWCAVLPATQHHMVWECGHRPPRTFTPASALQARLGWPCGNGNDYVELVLNHLSGVVLDAIERRRDEKKSRGVRGDSPPRPGTEDDDEDGACSPW